MTWMAADLPNTTASPVQRELSALFHPSAKNSVMNNRLRLTADGTRPCLLSEIEIPLREAIRKGEDILPLLQKAVLLKPAGMKSPAITVQPAAA